MEEKKLRRENRRRKYRKKQGQLLVPDELDRAREDLVERPPPTFRPAVLEVEHVANLVARAQDQVDVRLGVRGRAAEPHSVKQAKRRVKRLKVSVKVFRRTSEKRGGETYRDEGSGVAG